jgi:hypothetical protein
VVPRTREVVVPGTRRLQVLILGTCLELEPNGFETKNPAYVGTLPVKLWNLETAMKCINQVPVTGGPGFGVRKLCMQGLCCTYLAWAREPMTRINLPVGRTRRWYIKFLGIVVPGAVKNVGSND